MTFDEFKDQLEIYLRDDESSERFAESNDEEVIEAPFDNFFHDPLFLLLYNCAQPLPPELDTVRHLLRRVSDESIEPRERAIAAVSLAKAAQTLCAKPVDLTCGTDARFLELATQWGNVQAHIELAVIRLREADMSLMVEAENPLPALKADGDFRKTRAFLKGLKVWPLWQSGAELALAAADSHFENWTLTELTAAFSCVVHLIAVPDDLSEPRDLDSDRAGKLRRWVVPLLRLLYQRIHEIAHHDNSLLKCLKRQMHAIQMLLTAAIRVDSTNVIECKASDSEGTVAKVVVIKGMIPKASDRADNDLLKQYEALRKPLALATMPSRERIDMIQSTLEREFPWATAAIETIVSEIRARSRFGSAVLGMQPVLLCGPPGTGKTRLTQRIADLLGIPSTVINLAGMTDTKSLKGVTRGWASNRPSKILESILHNGPSHLFLLDEVDKAHGHGTHSGDPQEALLDLLEPQNARRYTDIFLQTECDVSHCLYIATANSLARISQPLLSRLCLAYVPAPGPEHAMVIAEGLLRDIERAWQIPVGVLEISGEEKAQLVGLSPREMRRVLMAMLGSDQRDQRFTLH